MWGLWYVCTHHRGCGLYSLLCRHNIWADWFTEPHSTELHSTEAHSTEAHSTEAHSTEAHSVGYQPIVTLSESKQWKVMRLLLKQPEIGRFFQVSSSLHMTIPSISSTIPHDYRIYF